MEMLQTECKLSLLLMETSKLKQLLAELTKIQVIDQLMSVIDQHDSLSKRRLNYIEMGSTINMMERKT